MTECGTWRHGSVEVLELYRLDLMNLKVSSNLVILWFCHHWQSTSLKPSWINWRSSLRSPPQGYCACLHKWYYSTRPEWTREAGSLQSIPAFPLCSCAPLEMFITWKPTNLPRYGFNISASRYDGLYIQVAWSMDDTNTLAFLLPWIGQLVQI